MNAHFFFLCPHKFLLKKTFKEELTPSIFIEIKTKAIGIKWNALLLSSQLSRPFLLSNVLSYLFATRIVEFNAKKLTLLLSLMPWPFMPSAAATAVSAAADDDDEQNQQINFTKNLTKSKQWFQLNFPTSIENYTHIHASCVCEMIKISDSDSLKGKTK